MRPASQPVMNPDPPLVVLAFDGQAGVDMAGSETPDLILMDMSLLVLDGWEATRRIKAAPSTCHIPIIALTAHAMSGDRDKAIEAGCNEYDTKPIDLARVLGKIEMLLEESEASGNEPFVRDLKKIRAAGWKLLALMDANFQPLRVVVLEDKDA